MVIIHDIILPSDKSIIVRKWVFKNKALYSELCATRTVKYLA